MSQATMTLATEASAPTLPGTLGSIRAPRSLWSNAWRQFRRNKLAIAGLIYLTFLAFVAVLAPVIAPHNPVQSDLRTAGKYRQAAWIETDNPKTTGDWSYPLGHRRQRTGCLQSARLRNADLACRRLHPDGGHHDHWHPDRANGRLHRRTARQLPDAPDRHRLRVPRAPVFHHHADLFR